MNFSAAPWTAWSRLPKWFSELSFRRCASSLELCRGSRSDWSSCLRVAGGRTARAARNAVRYRRTRCSSSCSSFGCCATTDRGNLISPSRFSLNVSRMLHSFFAAVNRFFSSISFVLTFVLLGSLLFAQEKIVWNDQEKPIVAQINGLRKLDDTTRARTTKELALEIRSLPAGPHKLGLAGGLANLSTEGDFGRDTLQEVTTTLATALREYPPVAKPDGPNHHYMELATLVRYEHMKTDCNDPQFTDALAKLAAADSA